MNATTLDLLIKYPSVFFLNFIVEPFAGAAFAYGLVWLVMRQKAGRRMSIPFVWHSCGLATTVIGSAIFRVVAMVTFAGQSAYKPVASTGAMGFYMLIVPAVVAAVYIGLLRRHSAGIGAEPPHLEVMGSARKDKGWRWFKLVAGMMLLAFGIRFILAFFENDSHNKAALAVFGGVIGTIVFGGIAYYLGWLTGENKQQETPSMLPELAASPITNASAIDTVYEAIDKELMTENLDRATWTRAQGDAEGDSERTKALYIKYRAQRLLSASPLTPIGQSPIVALSAGTLGQQFSFKVVAAGLGVVALIAVTGVSLWYSNKAPKGGFVPLDLGESKQPKSWDEVMADSKPMFEGQGTLVPDSKPISKDVPKGKQLEPWEMDWSKGVPKTVQPDAQVPWVDLTEPSPKSGQLDAQSQKARTFNAERKIQQEKLDKAMPDWREIVGEQYSKTPYRQWLAKQPAKYQTEINTTESADLILRSIARFKAETK